MADWLDVFYDELWDALPEMNMEEVEKEARKQAWNAAADRRGPPGDFELAVGQFYHGYMQQVHEALTSKELRARALRERGRG